MRLCDGLWQRALQFVACYFDQHQEPLDALPPHGAPPWRVRRLPDWKEFSLIITILKRIQDGRRQALMLAAQSQGSAPAGDSSDTERTARLAASLREAAERLRRMDLDDDEPDDL
ncbi:MAG: hypothetical protein Kow0059_06560 [Candidatus Sumerlaeia bacterium]